MPVHCTRHRVVLEIYSPGIVLRTSEVLSEFNMVVSDRQVYRGRAVVKGLVNTGTLVVCEATLEDNWLDVDFSANGQSKLGEAFRDFIQQWERHYKVSLDYKVIIADMHSFFSEMRLWLDQVELGIRSTPSGDRLSLGQELVGELGQSIVPMINTLFEKFESIASRLDEELRPLHCAYMKRQLHPLLLCSPFAYRTFTKPLGYAGDYEVVNMIAREAHEGSTLFAKIVNLWFLKQPPAEAHRNRIECLAQKLLEETVRVRSRGRPARVLSLACGPAVEMQRFIERQEVSNEASLVLIDFNDETLQHAGAALAEVKKRHHRHTPVQMVRKSVQQVLKEAGKTVARAADQQYDFVYCTGIYDYLSDPVCQRLTEVLYDWVAPGGLFLATNVDPSNPLRNGMEHLLDWNLVYRNGQQLRALKPAGADPDQVVVKSDLTGVNLVFEARKP